LTGEGLHVPIPFMRPQRISSESGDHGSRFKDWPTGDPRLEQMESQIMDLAEINEIGMSFIRHLDAEAAALAAAGGAGLADIARSRRELSREIRLNRKLAAEIGEDHRRRMAELGITLH
jgi:hypothetical protein